MIYLRSTFHDSLVRIDEENDEAFIKVDGAEYKAEKGNKVVADANLEDNQITEAEYNAG